MACPKSLLLFVVQLLFFSNSIFADCDAPLVETSEGYVRGTTSFSRNGRVFNIYRGIPYAKPPVGDLRFQVIISMNLNFQFRKSLQHIFHFRPHNHRKNGFIFEMPQKKVQFASRRTIFSQTPRWKEKKTAFI